MDMEVMKIHNDLTQQNTGTRSKQPNKADKLYATYSQIMSEHNLVYVESIRELYCLEGNIYQKMSERKLRDLVTEASFKFQLRLLPNEYNDTIELMRIHSPMVEGLSRNCIMISDNLYWDRQMGEIIRKPSESVFYRLFDTDESTTKIVKIPPFTEEQEQIFWKRYEQVRSELERGEEVERYEFIKTWANGSHDVYMDLHRAHAYMFLKKKPLGSYILIGLKRNGKSTYLNLTHSIMGTNNTSMVQLCDLGDTHQNHGLMTTLMNAPDEEEDQAVKAQGFFKSMADHGRIMLPVMRSNVPVALDCDFMSFFPMNHTPEWTGTGAAACMNRSLIIPFNADLSAYDKTSDNFMKETFTPDVMADYLGSVFAYAWWYHRHDFDFSETMKTEQGVLEQDLDSCLTYYKRFTRYFDGFENFKMVYEDYQNWCQAQDVKINTRKELKFVFRAICNSRTTYRRNGIRADNPSVKVYRIPDGKQPLMINFNPPEKGVQDLETLHKNNCSIVDRLDVYYAAQGIE